MTINEEMGIEEFVKRIKDSIDKNPTNRYLFFIGAGCSIPSGIPGANQLSNQWLDELKYFLKPDEYSNWIEKNIDTNDKSNMAKFYSTIIKKRFPVKSDRQQEMERLIDNGNESFGYVVLAHLLTSKKYGKNFNIVFTTNFDNLIAESIYRYTSEKARIISHDSLMSFVNTQSHKPQIVKLHGDVEFDPKNTEEETFQLNDDALETVKHTLTNCGLIFVGYGGNDKSIINSLIQISEKSITNGIFWIRNSLPESKLKDWLTSREHSFWIKHSNFDLMMMYFLKYFDIPRPDKKRCLDAENDFQKSLENLGKQIENIDSPKKNQFREILQKYVSSVDDWISLSTEANDISKTDFKKAVGLYEEGIKKFKDNTNLLNRFGILYFENLKYEEALKLYDQALELDPDNISGLSNKALVFDRMGKYEEALKLYDQALELDPDNSTTLANKASLLDNMGKHEEALKLYDQALEFRPADVIALSNKALTLEHMGKHEEALKLYDQAFELDPDNLTTINNKAMALDNMGKYEEALKLYDQSLKIKSDDPFSLSNKAMTLDNMGKHEEALKLYDQSLELDPDNPTVLNNLGSLLDNMGKHEEALKLYDRSLKIRPNFPTTINNKGLALNHMGKPQEALLLFEKSLELDPDNASALNNKGLSLNEMGKPQEALLLFEKSLELEPSNHVTISNKGLAFNNMGKYEEALKFYDQSLKIKSDNPTTLANKATALDNMGKSEEALKLYDQSLELDPGNQITLKNKNELLNKLKSK